MSEQPTLEDVFAMAEEVYDSAERGREFLSRPHYMLEGRLPIEVARESPQGAARVINILGRGAFGGGV